MTQRLKALVSVEHALMMNLRMGRRSCAWPSVAKFTMAAMQLTDIVHEPILHHDLRGLHSNHTRIYLSANSTLSIVASEPP